MNKTYNGYHLAIDMFGIPHTILRTDGIIFSAPFPPLPDGDCQHGFTITEWCNGSITIERCQQQCKGLIVTVKRHGKIKNYDGSELEKEKDNDTE